LLTEKERGICRAMEVKNERERLEIGLTGNKFENDEDV